MLEQAHQIGDRSIFVVIFLVILFLEKRLKRSIILRIHCRLYQHTHNFADILSSKKHPKFELDISNAHNQ